MLTWVFIGFNMFQSRSTNISNTIPIRIRWQNLHISSPAFHYLAPHRNSAEKNERSNTKAPHPPKDQAPCTHPGHELCIWHRTHMTRKFLESKIVTLLFHWRLMLFRSERILRIRPFQKILIPLTFEATTRLKPFPSQIRFWGRCSFLFILGRRRHFHDMTQTPRIMPCRSRKPRGPKSWDSRPPCWAAKSVLSIGNTKHPLDAILHTDIQDLEDWTSIMNQQKT